MEVQWPASTISFELEFSMMNHRLTAHKLIENKYVRKTKVFFTYEYTRQKFRL